MDSLDSRSLRYVDCFAQRFAQAGNVRYELATRAAAALPLKAEVFTIAVAKAPRRRGAQHTVVVTQVEGRLRADPEHLEIEAGDMVLWNTPEASVPGYVVRGEGAGGAFSSAELEREAVFTHAFGLPGRYEWVDANGGRIGGEVVVETVDGGDDRAAARWRKSLSTGSVVTIRGDTVRPRRVTILPGQTVFWAVERASGVSVTDARMAPQAADALEKATTPTARKGGAKGRRRKGGQRRS
jgi:plastocyanin